LKRGKSTSPASSRSLEFVLDIQRIHLHIGYHVSYHGSYILQPDKFGKLTISPSTTLQGLLLFAQHDDTLLTTIERTGIFDTMFSAPAKKAAYLILANAEQVVAFQNTYMRIKQLLTSEQSSLSRIIKSLDTVIQLNTTAHPGEAFLTALALSLKIFLEIVLRSTTTTEEDCENTAFQLMEVLQKREQQLCTSLALCASLEVVFWQSMMGAIAARINAQTKSFYISRLRRITDALALTSWHDAELILRRFFWVPSIFSAPCYRILSEIQYSHGSTGVISCLPEILK